MVKHIIHRTVTVVTIHITVEDTEDMVVAMGGMVAAMGDMVSIVNSRDNVCKYY